MDSVLSVSRPTSTSQSADDDEGFEVLDGVRTDLSI